MKPVTDKQFCPYCKLELDGAGHKYETQAWDLYNCEYNRTNSEKDPIPEYEINLSEIEKLKEEIEYWRCWANWVDPNCKAECITKEHIDGWTTDPQKRAYLYEQCSLDTDDEDN